MRALMISSSSVGAWPTAASISSSVNSSVRMSARAAKSGLPPSIISVPRPAMLVAMVTAFFLPACATISASFSWFFAFSTLCFTPVRSSMPDSRSDFSTDTVPTSTGRPVACTRLISSTTARNLPGSVAYITSFMSSRTIGLLVGICTTSSV